ncbi:hypothetical protein Hypma_009644 [Hypsizygus marmoreus]|uniref:TFIIS N-terminal domain-containing protein n=1 Tax=Hypsizygus marmoreus TaxID=39966 RepID=A0A369JM19_HYPMA|nr:hypothetical protein Hypma_009644 [Hypsizygus marmoreus]
MEIRQIPHRLESIDYSSSPPTPSHKSAQAPLFNVMQPIGHLPQGPVAFTPHIPDKVIHKLDHITRMNLMQSMGNISMPITAALKLQKRDLLLNPVVGQVNKNDNHEKTHISNALQAIMNSCPEISTSKWQQKKLAIHINEHTSMARNFDEACTPMPHHSHINKGEFRAQSSHECSAKSSTTIKKPVFHNGTPEEHCWISQVGQQTEAIGPRTKAEKSCQVGESTVKKRKRDDEHEEHPMPAKAARIDKVDAPTLGIHDTSQALVTRAQPKAVQHSTHVALGASASGSSRGNKGQSPPQTLKPLPKTIVIEWVNELRTAKYLLQNGKLDAKSRKRLSDVLSLVGQHKEHPRLTKAELLSSRLAEEVQYVVNSDYDPHLRHQAQQIVAFWNNCR